LHLSVCVSAALVTMAAELIQEDLTLTRRVGQSVSFSCGGTEDKDKYWYQKKEREPFKIILQIVKNNCKTNKGYGHSQKDDFTGEKTQRGCELKINQVKVDHSASYYCSCWSHSEK
uniref:Immunoglobulin V-set domain-containing protein n=1 Tax=Oryzias melastigma TaxID=30732 RepID=A0A3B3CY35_ORYME